jgi:hypothetical protein
MFFCSSSSSLSLYFVWMCGRLELEKRGERVEREELEKKDPV